MPNYQQFYVLDKSGRIVNGISAPSRSSAERHIDLTKYTVKHEDDIPLSVLEQYQYWNERP